MLNYKTLNRRTLSTLTLASAIVLPAVAVQAADHLDAPSVASNGQSDINDLYAFQSPTNAANTVLIMTVNPLAGLPRPVPLTFGGPPSPTTFSSTVAYQFLIDNDGDAIADIGYTTTFSSPSGGSQNLVTSLTTGGTTTAYASGSTDSDIATVAGGRIRAGLFDDPFFFDFASFKDGLNFTGTDTFAGANVSAIVLELPSAELVNANVGIYANTLEDGTQIDRVGRPGINTVLIPSGSKDAFNAGDPVNDPAEFTDEIEASLTALGGDPSLSGILLPDLLTFDTTSSDGFLNGRKLTDDVIDTELGLVSGGALTTDGVDGNDKPFLNVFPFLAAPNGQTPVVPTPSAALAGLALIATLGLRRRRA